MDASDCDCLFSRSELSKALTGQATSRLEQIAFEASIDQANIPGLEKCPFCVWAIIIENDAERLFRCGNQVELFSLPFCSCAPHNLSCGLLGDG